MFDFKVKCAKVPNLSYAESMELRVLAHEMVAADFPKTEHWRTVQQFGSNKYKLHPWRNQGRQHKGILAKDKFYDKMLF